jgi:hypoxanthine phosphoribosyltransferase
MENVSILISEEAIVTRVNEMAAEIRAAFGERRITLVCALKGAVIFMADLARRLSGEVEFDFVGTTSYGDSSTSSGKVRLTKEPDLDLSGRSVLIVEDILDTGHTLSFLKKYIACKNAERVMACCLLDKPDRRAVSGLSADFTGFCIPDVFVVGYGLDYAQRHRNLPYIGVLHIEE